MGLRPDFRSRILCSSRISLVDLKQVAFENVRHLSGFDGPDRNFVLTFSGRSKRIFSGMWCLKLVWAPAIEYSGKGVPADLAPVYASSS